MLRRFCGVEEKRLCVSVWPLFHALFDSLVKKSGFGLKKSSPFIFLPLFVVSCVTHCVLVLVKNSKKQKKQTRELALKLKSLSLLHIIINFKIIIITTERSYNTEKERE